MCRDKFVDKGCYLVEGELGRQERVEERGLIDRVAATVEDPLDREQLDIDLTAVESSALLG
jgi:hypothetical protein